MADAPPRRSRRVVVRRLRSLMIGELVACMVLLFVAFGMVDAPFTVANGVGAAATVFLLLQGSAYWLSKLRQLRHPSTDLGWARGFAVLRTANPVVLAICAVVIGRALVAGPLDHALAGLLFWILAVLEHVNYFHWQLMYDNRVDLAWLRRSGLKRSSLSRDLARLRRSGSGSSHASRA